MKELTSIKNFIKNFIDIDKEEGTGAASRIISKGATSRIINKGTASNIKKDSSVIKEVPTEAASRIISKAEKTEAASRIISKAEKTEAASRIISKGETSSIKKDSSNKGETSSNATSSNIINKDSSTDLMARIIDNTGEKITQLAKRFHEMKTSKLPSTELSLFYLELKHFQYKLGRPVVYNLFDQLRSWTACESVKVQHDLADFLRFFDLKSRNKRQLRLKNNFLRKHRQLHLVLEHFTIWFNIRKLQVSIYDF